MAGKENQYADSQIEAQIKGIPLPERLALALGIKETIDIPSMRAHRAKNGEAVHMWGIVWMDGLPFCFVARRGFEKQLKYLRDGFFGESFVSRFEAEFPYCPDRFSPPSFTTPLSLDDMKGIIIKLEPKRAVTEEKIREQFLEVIRGREKQYEKFYQTYKDPLVKMPYGAAVSLACEEKLVAENGIIN